MELTMPEPQTFNTDAAMTALQARLNQRGLGHITAGPVTDEPSEDQPGHPSYHRRIRTEFALARWHVATPPRYRRAEATDPGVIAWADHTAQNPDEATSLLLTGGTGTGKTYQAYGALRRIAEAGPRRYEIIATTAADMYSSLRPGGSRANSDQDLGRLAHVPLLLLDDLGSAKASEWVEEITYRLINERYNQCLPTIFTSNFPTRAERDKEGRQLGPDLISIFGDRIVSRLAEMTTVVAIAGTDRRRAA
jgi:DNA replication protein DnaC